MLQAAGGARLSGKALARGGIVKALFEQLDDDLSIDGRIAGEVDRTHAAMSDQPIDVIPANGGRRHGYPSSGRRSRATAGLTGAQ